MGRNSLETPRSTRSTLAIGSVFACPAGVVITLLVVLGGATHHPDAAFGVYAFAALLLTAALGWAAAPPSVACLWLFYDGFVIGRHGALSWHGGADLWRVAALSAAGLLGGLSHWWRSGFLRVRPDSRDGAPLTTSGRDLARGVPATLLPITLLAGAPLLATVLADRAHPSAVVSYLWFIWCAGALTAAGRDLRTRRSTRRPPPPAADDTKEPDPWMQMAYVAARGGHTASDIADAFGLPHALAELVVEDARGSGFEL